MERTYINEAQKAIGGTVKVQGFIENLRNSKYMAFIVLKDITGKLQITVEKADHPELVDTIDQLTPDSVITVTGKVMENDYVKMGGIEMIPEAIEIESIANALPIVRKEIAATKKKKAVERSSIDQRIDYRWIDLRTDENQLMFKAQSCFVNAMRQFLLERSFIEIHTPKLIAAASESGSEVFKVDYFDRNAYLAQSPQFYKQMAMAAGFERIFETGPVFRAEKSYTNKHSTEFSGFDLEFSYITSYKDVMKMEEELLTAGLKAVKEQYGEQIKELFGLEVVVPTMPFPVVKLADLYKALEEEFGYTVDESEKGDLTTEAERLSYDWVKKHYGHEFLFITDYSAEKRAFYHMRDENGVPHFLPAAYNEDGSFNEDFVNIYALGGRGQWPRFMNWEYEMLNGTDLTLKERTLWGDVDTTIVLPPLTVTGNEAVEYTSILSDAKTATLETFINVVLGNADVFALDTLDETLKTMKIDRAIEILQAAYDNYEKK